MHISVEMCLNQLTYGKSLNKPPGSYLQNEFLGGGLFKGEGLICKSDFLGGGLMEGGLFEHGGLIKD